MGFISHRGFEPLSLRHFKKLVFSKIKVDKAVQRKDNKRLNKAPVAQLDRVIGFEPIGRGFESLRAHQY